MPLVTKGYTFSLGQTADPSQVNQDLDTLYTLVNGELDSQNLAAGAVATANVANEAVTAGKTEGVAYSVDMLGNSCVFSGLTVTKDGSTPSQIDVTAGVAYVKQTDGSLRRFATAATNFRTASASATYYLDLNPDGTWSFTTGHSSQANYLNVATVTSDASANVSTITTATQTVTPFGNANVQLGGKQTALSVSASGLTGATSASRWVGATASGAPTNGTFVIGDFVIDQSGSIWICTVAGTPGTWVNPKTHSQPRVNLFRGSYATTSASAVAMPNNTSGLFQFTYHASEWTNTQFYFEAYLSVASGTTGFVGLYDVTASSAISTAEVSTTSPTPATIRSGSFTLTDGHVYSVFVQVGSSSYTLNVYGADLLQLL